ncbi:MAG: hypothetical protein NVSMB38_26800 [Ktedonobacteraceae bacterium]
MAEVHEEALISREGQPALASSLGAKRSGRAATKLDNLFVLAAVLAYTFGWGPTFGNQAVGFYVTGPILIVTVSLLWLLCERVVSLKGRWVVSDGWLCSLTQGDVLILLLAILNSPLLHIPLLVAVVIWGFVSGIAWLRGRRAGADDWFHRAAIFASFVAIMIGDEASKVWLYSGAVGTSPSPLTHAGFHQFLDGAVGVSCTLLLLFLAWKSLRQGQGWAVSVLWVSGFPAAALAGWAAVVSVINQHDYGDLHTYAWLLSMFWMLSVLSAVRGLALQPRTPSTEDG